MQVFEKYFGLIWLLLFAACSGGEDSILGSSERNEAPAAVQIATDTFVQEDGLPGATAGVGDIVPRAVRYVGRHDRTYIAYGDRVCNPVIAFFDHRTREWGSPVQIGSTGVPDGSHGLPSLAFDGDGRLHALCGSHGGTHYMRVASQPESIDE